ncbi:MAG: biotin--[acetyl-CoA-carboxylase] ligase [Flavicella sp.]
MELIKLDATASTNTFLKNLASNTLLSNFTVVTTESQHDGRGQMGAKWVSEPSKNLLFSVYFRHDNFSVNDGFFLSMSAALAAYKVLISYEIPKLSVKWPNDIMSGNKKIGGFLIENSIKKNKVQHSIIGLGLNVNQKNFGVDLPYASSLSNELGQDLDKNILLDLLLNELQKEFKNCINSKFTSLKTRYLAVLYKFQIPTMFKDKSDSVFMGKIIDITIEGLLKVMLVDESIALFDLKEVRFVH